MRLSENVLLIGSGDLGVSLSDRFDSHVYAITTGDGIILVDTGSGRQPDLITEHLTRDGFSASDVRAVLLTHGHADHAGGAAWWAEGGVRILAHRDLVDAFATADEEALDVAVARSRGVYPRDYSFRAFEAEPIDCAVELTVGDATVQSIDSPGHSLGSVCYLVSVNGTRILFTGDSLFWGGRLALQPIPTCDVVASERTIRGLSRCVFEGLFPGHQLFALRNGLSHVQAAVRAFDSLNVPAQLV